ncbi:uncharacterized protein FA14DRAFT_155544 [Meira miltonrushii]|uniref:Uncharacterized protein n=1 Tax=Meira miltonrushii TaxID=1280837 RepID=A0A316VJE0_9BASI|nr:uncharacterized protein FA14DRAFT_155544 [Meira miltonrushii]PWN36141.1 hypothetical protein FA14DRAFT_155544 [Meira miltonrushii]
MSNQAENENQSVMLRIDTVDQDDNEGLRTPPKSELSLDKIQTQTRSSMVRQISMDQCPTSSNLEEINPFVEKHSGTTQGGVGSLRYDCQDDDVPKDVVTDDENDEQNDFIGTTESDNSPNSVNEDLFSSPKTSFRVPPGTPYDEKNNQKSFIAGYNGGQIGIGHRRNDFYEEQQQEGEDESQFDTSTSAFLTTSDTFGLPFPRNFSLSMPNDSSTPKERQHAQQQSDCDTGDSNVENEQNDSLSSLFPLQKTINRPRQPSFPMRLTASLLLAKGQEEIAENTS